MPFDDPHDPFLDAKACQPIARNRLAHDFSGGASDRQTHQARKSRGETCGSAMLTDDR